MIWRFKNIVLYIRFELNIDAATRMTTINSAAHIIIYIIAA